MQSQDLDQSKNRMEKAIQNLEEEFNTIRVGRANPHVLDRITVDYYGTMTPLNQVGNISVPEPRMLMIQPWDASMEKAIQNLEEEFNTIRVGRANPHVLDRITVDYYGTMTPLNQVGNISVPEPRMLMIQPWDASMVKAIEKALNASELGIHPTSDGKVIRLVFPELTEEKRKETSKEVKKKGEAAKVAIRNIRRDMMDSLKKQKKDNEITEDDQKDLEEKLQKMTDEFIKKVDQRVEVKTKEVMAI